MPLGKRQRQTKPCRCARRSQSSWKKVTWTPQDDGYHATEAFDANSKMVVPLDNTTGCARLCGCLCHAIELLAGINVPVGTHLRARRRSAPDVLVYKLVGDRLDQHFRARQRLASTVKKVPSESSFGRSNTSTHWIRKGRDKAANRTRSHHS